MNVFILCEGKCSLSVPIAVLEALEKDRVQGLQLSDERNRVARQAITERLVLRPHTFQRALSKSTSTQFIFACTECGKERIYGAVAELNNDLRKMYGLSDRSQSQD